MAGGAEADDAARLAREPVALRVRAGTVRFRDARERSCVVVATGQSSSSCRRAALSCRRARWSCRRAGSSMIRRRRVVLSSGTDVVEPGQRRGRAGRVDRRRGGREHRSGRRRRCGRPGSSAPSGSLSGGVSETTVNDAGEPLGRPVGRAEVTDVAGRVGRPRVAHRPRSGLRVRGHRRASSSSCRRARCPRRSCDGAERHGDRWRPDGEREHDRRRGVGEPFRGAGEVVDDPAAHDDRRRRRARRRRWSSTARTNGTAARRCRRYRPG